MCYCTGYGSQGPLIHLPRTVIPPELVGRPGKSGINGTAGARYEGQWERGAKKGEGMYVFEDNSVWKGTWAKDQPVEASSTHPFAAQSNCPKIYIDDLLDRESNPAFASKGEYLKYWHFGQVHIYCNPSISAPAVHAMSKGYNAQVVRARMHKTCIVPPALENRKVKTEHDT